MEPLPPPGSGPGPGASLAEPSAFFAPTPPVAPSAYGSATVPPPPPSGGGTATLTAVSPNLPQVAPPVPRPATAPANNPFGTMLNDSAPLGTSRPPKKPKRGKRFAGALLVLALIGGAAAAAWTYGSDLMTLGSSDEVVDETELANAFPLPVDSTPAIRTASFTVERPAGADGPDRYQATIDFDTTIAEVMIDGGDDPDMEMLTLFNDAVVRERNSVVWYQLPRGTFPIDIDAGRARWVRTVDELFPPAIRQWATIERATESEIEGEPMTRLLVSIDPARLATAPAPPDGTTTASTASAPTPTLPPGLTLTTTPDGAVTGTVSIELWFDDANVIRKLVLPPELGGETVIVSSYSADSWQPAFPPAEQVQPITANALVDLAF